MKPSSVAHGFHQMCSPGLVHFLLYQIANTLAAFQYWVSFSVHNITGLLNDENFDLADHLRLKDR